MSPLVALLLLPAIAGGDPDFDAVAAQIKAGKVEKDKWIGHRDSGKEARSTHEAGVLVGFEVGVTERFDNRWIVAVRPIFRTPNGAFAGDELGSFDPRKHTDGAVKKHGIKAVELIAKPGYAVAAVHTMNSIGFIHFSLTYAKATETGLDPTDTYESEEVGRSKEGQAFVGTTRTNGKFGVGALGHVHNNIVFAMNLLHLKEGGLTTVGSEKPPVRSPEPVKPAPLPTPKAEPPTLSVPVPKPADPLPAPTRQPKSEPAPQPAELLKKFLEPIPPPAPQVVATPADEIKAAVFKKDPEPPPAQSTTSWVIPVAVGGVVTAVVVGLLLLLGGKSADKPRRKAIPVARVAADQPRRARRADD